jgi:predicted XRE-type DNA-binding protein
MKELFDSLSNEISLMLFDKHYDNLQISEVNMIRLYLEDIFHPVWSEIIIDGQYTGYKINKFGTIIDKYGKEIKKYQLKEDWYYQVYINKFGLKLVHRLVAQAFIPNPDNKPQVNHINGKKTCNWVGNLEWVTAKENSEHAWNCNLVNNAGENQGSTTYTNEQIREVCKLLEENILSYEEISKITGVKKNIISSIKTGNTWKSISGAFTLPPKKEKLYSDDKITEVCKLLENPDIPQTEISKITGVSVNTIKDIMKKSSYSRISDKFNIVPRNNYGASCPVSKYSEKQIHQVCKLLEDNKMSVKYISENTGVKLGIIYDIRRGTKWKSISKNYNI